jgi:hypothetical protein
MWIKILDTKSNDKDCFPKNIYWFKIERKKERKKERIKAE